MTYKVSQYWSWLSDRIQREEDCDEDGNGSSTTPRLELSDRIQREEDCDPSPTISQFRFNFFQTASRGKRIAT